MQLSQDEEGDVDDERHEVPAAGETPLQTRIIRELLEDDDNVEVLLETPSAEGSNFAVVPETPLGSVVWDFYWQHGWEMSPFGMEYRPPVSIYSYVLHRRGSHF